MDVKTFSLRTLFLLFSVVTLSACGGGGSSGGDGDEDNPVPVLNALTPSTVTAGSAGTTVTVTGSGFVASSVVRVNMATTTAAGLLSHAVEGTGVAELPTSFVSATELTVELEEADLASAGTASVTVFNPAPGGGESGAQTFTIQNPVPTLTGLAPNSTQVGGDGFELFVNGTGFVDGSVVYWGGSPRTTTFISNEQISAAITAGDIATIGSVDVTVETPATAGPGGGTSGPQTFDVSALPQPQVSGLLPASGIPVGSGDFTLTVNGNNFQSISVVRWNGADRTTTFAGDPTQLTALIPGTDITSTGDNSVTVFTAGVGGGGGGESDPPVTFTVNPLPSVAGLVPDNLPEGNADFVLTVNGANFLDGATVLWNGMARTTRFIGAGEVEADIAMADVATPGMVNVTVMNPDTGMSNAAVFTINPLPSVNVITPDTLPADDSGFEMVVTGANFQDGATVLWNGVARTTRFNNAGELEADINAGDIDDRPGANVTVQNPDGGLSNAVGFTVTNPVPVAAGLSTAGTAGPNIPAGGANFVLTISGAGFTSESVVRWNGADRTTRRNAFNELEADILAGDIVAAGSAQVTVFNPDVGAVPGGTSNARTFYITSVAAPVIDMLTPDTLAQAAVEPALQVDGSGFNAGSVVRWNGIDLVTTFVNNTQLTAAVTAVQTANEGCFPLTVYSPSGGTSNAATLRVGGSEACDPAPVLDELVPRSVPTGSADITLNVIGSGFSADSVVRWNGEDRLPTQFVSDSLLRTTITSADLVAAGVFAVTVASDGDPIGLSQPETFFVLDGGGAAFYDNFNREDAGDLGNDWIEKTPAAFSVAGRGLTAPNTDPEDYHNVIVYRPMAEDRRDVEVSVEFVKRAGDDRFAQLHLRAQRASIEMPDRIESYVFFIDDRPAPGFAIIARQDVDPNVFSCAIDGVALPTTLVEGQRYRMRFSAVGEDPVVLTGTVQELNSDGTWVDFASVTASHADGTTTAPGFTCNSLPAGMGTLGARITNPGAVGIAKFTDESEFYDNFYWRDPTP